MKDSFKEYIDTLTLTNNELFTFVDFEKVVNNLSSIQIHLNSLNYLICSTEEELITRIRYLFKENKKCFSIIPILIAVRNDFDALEKKYFVSNDSDLESIIIFFKSTKLLEFIIGGKIKNFVDYVYGIEVGLDSNARKNRTGKISEDKIEKCIRNFYVSDKHIEIYTQSTINNISNEFKDKYHLLNNKIFDFIILNKNTKKILLLESSFYNSGGSKISETSRSYFDLYKKIDEYKESLSFVWIADGEGMKTIKNDLISKFDFNYITNFNLLYNKLKLIK
ncbi:MAG: DpnII family type II restriction endonuclease [Malacoplasma sp.]